MEQYGKILVVEDVAEYQLMVGKILGAKFDLKVIDDGSKIFDAVQNHNPDLILLDIDLPGEDGFHLCTQLQGNPDTTKIPIIFVSSRSEVTDKVLGLKVGATDYIVKPFNLMEFTARVESTMKLVSKYRENVDTLTRGNLSLNKASQELRIKIDQHQKVVELSKAEYKLMLCLLNNEGIVLSREKILDSVWGTSISVLDRTVDAHVSSLRRKCSPYEYYFESVYGTGYKFNTRSTVK